MARARGFPEPRLRAPGRTPGDPEKFERYESSGEITCANALADVFTFSGKPDSIELTARTFPVIVRLANRIGEETSDILVPVGVTMDTHISRERVQARNAIADSVGILCAVGKWAAPREPW